VGSRSTIARRRSPGTASGFEAPLATVVVVEFADLPELHPARINRPRIDAATAGRRGRERFISRCYW
jgi:hypothetical protein